MGLAGDGWVVIRAASEVGIPTIGQYTDHLSWSVFLEVNGGALLNVQKSIKLGIFAAFCLNRGYNEILHWQPWW